MLAMLARYWWVFALRRGRHHMGMLAIIWPGLVLLTLVTLFGAYALADGVFSVISGIVLFGRNQGWWPALLRGVAGIIWAY